MDVKISDLKFYEKNAKAHPPEQIEKIKRSIEKFGFRGGIKVTSDLTLITGHGRVIALKDLGYEEVEVEVIEDLKPEDIKAYRLADNKTAESEWLDNFLAEELAELQLMDFDLNYTGFSEFEVDNLLNEKVSDHLKEWEDMPEFNQDDLTPIRQIIISFSCQQDIDSFSKLVGQPITDKTKSLWFPKVDNEKVVDKHYE